ncbi:MAG TPA: L,D-transpeptidase family protein [Steroidobacteraceae bacterium]|nr:L,D-transpeptidase family protein [Steroidobacteraceae bacterium]
MNTTQPSRARPAHATWNGPLGATFVVLASLLLISGCALVGRRPPPPAPVVQAAPPPPPKPQLPEPVDTHRFVLSADQEVVGTVQITTARKQDTLLDIARRFNVGYNEIVNANPGVDIWIPGEGKRVVVPTQFILPAAPHVGIVIDVAALRLFYFPHHKPGEPQIVYTYPIGIGKAGWKTPEGVTHVTARVKDPVWHPSLALREDHFKDNGERLPAVVKAGPDNPLGKFEFRLGWPSYLIHGTNLPYGVGLRSSHGCVRLYPEDIEKLFQMVPVGTQVRVVNQPYLFGWRDHQLYLQVYPPLQDDHRNWQHAQKKLLTVMLHANAHVRTELATAGMQIDWESVAAIGAAPRDIPVPVTGPAASSGIDAVVAAAPQVQNRIPLGADWDGSDDASAAAKTPQQVLSDLEPGTASTRPTAVISIAHGGTPGG